MQLWTCIYDCLCFTEFSLWLYEFSLSCNFTGSFHIAVRSCNLAARVFTILSCNSQTIVYELRATTPTRDDGRNCNCASIWCYWSLWEHSHHLPNSCTIKPVLGVTIKAIAKLSVCILQNCDGIGVRANSPPQHLTTPLSEIACNSSLLRRSSARMNTHEHRCRPLR